MVGRKKTWIPTVVVPHHEALALPISFEQQREAHAEYKYTLVLHVFIYGTRMRVHIHASNEPKQAQEG